MSARTAVDGRHRGTALPWLWAGYTLLLIYGTTYPLGNWDWSLGGLEQFLAISWPERVPRSDFILNLIVYLPFGLLAVRCLPGGSLQRLLLATLLGCSLSASLELAQTWLPNRVSSLADLALNTTGALLGSIAGILVTQLPFARRSSQQLRDALRDPASGKLALLVLALWAVAQLAPLVPSLDLDNLRAGVRPLIATLNGTNSIDQATVLRYLLMIFAIGCLAMAAFDPQRFRLSWWMLCVLAVLAGKALVMGRVLSLESLLGAGIVLPGLWLLRQAPVGVLRFLTLCALLIHHALESLTPSLVDNTLRSLNWVPFSGHMNSLNGVLNLLATTWVFVALAWVTYPLSRNPLGRWLLGSVVLGATFALEWWQQNIPGRFPDITDVMVATGAWWIASSWPWHAGTETPTRPAPAVSRGTASYLRYWPWLGVGCLVLLSVAVTNLTREQPTAYRLPEVSQLATPEFPAWRESHPRLPVPSQEDIQLLHEHNPRFWNNHRDQASQGSLYSRILMARVEPGTVELEALHEDLLALEPTWRGHQQTKPLAVAYDWLHHAWTPSQRAALQEKVEQACQYQIHVIAEKYALSPYNVYLYNSPLQALMMAALAVHGDSDTDRCMRFTADYWRNRVLPVWRQVMGESGGWHEGGEYVGIGIGQAIHQLPYLWRHATGEDLFASEPGIRGFLDFAVHRVRPDGTHIRLGDAGFFGRAIPDLAPLALEYGHTAAYTLARPPAQPTPLGWPWGPLSDASLHNPSAHENLPTSARFDGIGLLLARSGWSQDATFVTFKAGDNYWSHSHLDQGAFTVFRGGALAIDSGLYHAYGSDHHLNYTYQSVAHNVVTVTDPDDTLPMPPRRDGDSPRDIANDGGQRRVGSGWGRPGPLDYQHWHQQRDHYRTVGATLQGEDGDLIWKVADLTPAYTNARSGRGGFAERSLRVTQYQRSFIFDKSRDLIIVYDRIVSSDPSFRKKWLLHSQYAPRIDNKDFVIEVPPQPKTSMSGGRLRGRILLPEDASLSTIGGPGFEFWVDGKNYDEDGSLASAVLRRSRDQGAEPGAWRLEVQPVLHDKLHEFLVVMRASSLGEVGASLPPLDFSSDGHALSLAIGSAQPVEIVIPRGLAGITVRYPKDPETLNAR